MDAMKELYEKVSKEATLQEKFTAIMKDAEAAGKEATEAKLTAFAKEAGYDISVEEMQTFFKELGENNKGELSDSELDMVAGGKSIGGTGNVIISVITIGIACAISSAMNYMSSLEGGNSCAEGFQ